MTLPRNSVFSTERPATGAESKTEQTFSPPIHVQLPASPDVFMACIKEITPDRQVSDTHPIRGYFCELSGTDILVTSLSPFSEQTRLSSLLQNCLRIQFLYYSSKEIYTIGRYLKACLLIPELQGSRCYLYIGITPLCLYNSIGSMVFQEVNIHEKIPDQWCNTEKKSFLELKYCIFYKTVIK